MKIKLLVTIIAGSALALGSVFAAEGDAKKKGDAKGKGGKGGDPAKMFEKIDTNADKTVSLEEWKAGPGKRAIEAGKGDNIDKMFAKMAGDDGKLTLEEFTAARAARAKKGKGDKKGKGGDAKKKKEA